LIAPDTDDSDIEMMDDITRIAEPSTLITQPYQPPTPLLSKKQISKLPTTDNTSNSNRPTISKTKTKPRTEPISDRIDYNITSDVLNQKANIEMKDLLIAAPALKRDLIKSIRNTKLPKANTLAFVEDDDVDTTAIYTTMFIDKFKVKAILDTGSAKTVMSKTLADTIGLKIDAPSTSIFTLGNGTKQAALGIIYDVPLNIGGRIVIPGSIEVLPVCPTQLIIGNNWMKRAKARLNLEDKSIKVEYKGTINHIPFVFTRGAEAPVVIKTSTTTHYTTEKEPTKSLVISDSELNISEESSSDEDDEDIDDLEPEGTTDEEHDDHLMMLEDDYEERNRCTCDCGVLAVEDSHRRENDFDLIIKKSFYITPYAQREYSINFDQIMEDPEDITDGNFKVLCNYSHPVFSSTDYLWSTEEPMIKTSSKGITFIISNLTWKTQEFKAGERLGEVEILREDEEDSLDCYNFNDSWDNHYDFKVMDIAEEDKAQNHYELNEQQLEEKGKTDKLLNKNVYDSNHELHDDYEAKLNTRMDISNIPSEVRTEFLDLIMRYDHLFDWNNDKIGNIDVMEHSIQLKPDAKPKRVRPYRLSPLETENLKEELDKLLKLGIIEKGGYSNWSSPIIMLKKKDGSYRIVADFRYLNSQSETLNYPLNNIDELLDTLNKAHWMTTFDLRSGFFQANISKESQPLTTVVCPLGDYYFKKLPMGIKTSPSVFSQMMEQCFHELVNLCVIIYLDDVTCYTNHKSPSHHLQDIERTFKCMDKHGIILNPKKCHFFKDRILFLGFIVTRNTIEPNPDTISKVKEFPLPRTIKQLRSFLGLCSYYRRFVPNFAKIARPLHNQLKLTKKVPWNDEATSAFNTLKEYLTSGPILRKPDFSLPFFVVTDASVQGLGAILTQKDSEGHEHPIIYSSRSLHGSEVNYGISKLELLAVVWAVKLYRPYLHGSPFTVTVISDHSALNGLLKTKQPSGILARWIEILSEYDYTIVYRPGRVNESADFLSRLGH
jgi:hypothetical protein